MTILASLQFSLTQTLLSWVTEKILKRWIEPRSAKVTLCQVKPTDYATLRDLDKRECQKQPSKARYTQVNVVNLTNDRSRDDCYLCSTVFIIRHALSCTQLVFRQATVTQLSFKWQPKTRKESCLFTERSLGFQTAGAAPELGTFRSRVQRSNHPTFVSRRDVMLIVPQTISACRLWRQKKKCVYCTIFIGIIWCKLEPLRPMYTEMSMYSEQEQNSICSQKFRHANEFVRLTWHAKPFEDETDSKEHSKS